MDRLWLGLFFLVSGTSGLVFEVLWSRMLVQVFGCTSFALSALLTAFMAGLALGSRLGGRAAPRLGSPLRAYGVLEGVVGGYALLVPWVLGWMPGVYAPLFEALSEQVWAFWLVRFALVFVVLLVPTACMGASLPLLAEELSRRQRAWEGSSALLYGVNTFGACAGTVAAGFWLLPTLGLARTNHIFAGVNLGLCAAVLLASWAQGGGAPSAAPAAPLEEEDEALLALEDPHQGAPERSLAPWMVRAVLGCFGVAGAVSMAYQVFWTRAYVMVLGSSTYSFSLILAVFLVGLAGGSAAASGWAQRLARPVWALALAQLGVCATAGACFFALNKAPEWLFHFLRGGTTLGSLHLWSAALVGLVVLPPTLLQGACFPLALRVVSDAERGAGRGAGEGVSRAYAVNTVGAIVGSFVSGFVLMPWLGLRGAVLVALGLNLALGLGLGALSLARAWEREKAWWIAGAAAAALAVVVAAPSLDVARLSSGAFRAYWSQELFTVDSFMKHRPELLFYRDGVAATVSVERRGGLITLKSNGKPEASNDSDMATQILVGLLPLVLHEATPLARRQQAAGVYEGPRDVAMVGFGSGVTAGASLQGPGVRRLDVVEIEGSMVEASRAFDEVNHRPLDDPRLRVIESDGRNFLEYAPHKYDAIVSEPSNPWIAGVASLFTVEHFQKARGRLKEGGVYCQWVQLYEMSPENVARIFKTFRAVFPHAIAFTSLEKGTDAILIGSEEPLRLGAEGFPRAFGDARTVAELGRAKVESPLELYGLLFLTEAELGAFIEGVERDLGRPIALNTDDNGVLEFEAPKDLLRYEEGDRFFARMLYSGQVYGDVRRRLDGYGDPQVWGAARLGALSRALFIKGKQPLALEVALEARRRGGDATAARVEEAAALDARGLRGVLELWPRPGSLAHQLLAQGLEGPTPAPALEALYQRAKPKEHQFIDDELGVAAAALWLKGGDVRRASKVLEHVKDGEVSGSAAGLALRGYLARKRGRFGEALGWYERAQEAGQRAGVGHKLGASWAEVFGGVGMARLHRDGWVVRVEGPGSLLVCSDLHGNLADLRRMVALWEAEPGAALLFLGDLFHGPSATEAQWRQKYEHLADWYPDESVEVFRELSALCARHPERVTSLLGNHDHAHVGGPVVSKFHADEAGAMEARMEPAEREALRSFLRGLPVIGVSECGVAFTHAAPPGEPFGRREVEGIKLDGYERVPLYAIHRAGLLGSVLWLRGSAHGSVGRFLESLAGAGYGARCGLVVHGHEIAPEGFESEHARIGNLSTSFGMKRAQKRYLKLDLSRRYEDALALRAGHELLPLYHDDANGGGEG